MEIGPHSDPQAQAQAQALLFIPGGAMSPSAMGPNNSLQATGAATSRDFRAPTSAAAAGLGHPAILRTAVSRRIPILRPVDRCFQTARSLLLRLLRTPNHAQRSLQLFLGAITVATA
eukprot:gene28108-31216_t